MKNLMNLGKTLNKNEQKEIFGGEKRGETENCATSMDCNQSTDCCHLGICMPYASWACQSGEAGE